MDSKMEECTRYDSLLVAKVSFGVDGGAQVKLGLALSNVSNGMHNTVVLLNVLPNPFSNTGTFTAQCTSDREVNAINARLRGCLGGRSLILATNELNPGTENDPNLAVTNTLLRCNSAIESCLFIFNLV